MPEDLGDPPELATSELLARLVEVRSTALAWAADRRSEIAALPEARRISATNLIHYLAVRSFDLRVEQQALSRLGLSSLGRSEAHILATLDAVIGRVRGDLGVDRAIVDGPALGTVGPSVDVGRKLLGVHADATLGTSPAEHETRVMVTLPSEAASDLAMVEGFVAAGMNLARINGAHDGPDAWRAMAANVRRAAARLGQPVRIAFDLPGPKLRTGEIEPGPAVRRIRPQRDAFGRVVRAGRVVFTAEHAELAEPDAVQIPAIGEAFFAAARPGDVISLSDARDRSRELSVSDVGPGWVLASTERTAYLRPGLELHRRSTSGELAVGVVGPLEPTAGFISLGTGERLQLRLGDELGHDARAAADGTIEQLASVGVDVADLYPSLRPGERVLLDDGVIEGTVVDGGSDWATIEIVRPARAKLRAAKGVNFPDLDLGTAALTEQDVAILEEIVDLVDLVSVSFVGGSADVADIHRHLERLGADHCGVVLKIERAGAFANFPEILLAALRRPPVAVMVARGDLAVEVGYERLAEVQEEILWLAEAAHVPVIWATQVLETLAKRGAPTRAEVTDAAWSGRAECVMLNKGPYMPDTIRFLGDVLGRMQEHRSKRTPMLRRLSVALGR